MKERKSPCSRSERGGGNSVAARVRKGDEGGRERPRREGHSSRKEQEEERIKGEFTTGEKKTIFYPMEGGGERPGTR